MKSLEESFQKHLESLNIEFANKKEVLEFEKTSAQFEKLVKKGMTKKRGYNLLSPTDANIKNQVFFNSKQL